MFLYKLDLANDDKSKFQYKFTIHSLLYLISLSYDGNKWGGTIGFFINKGSKNKANDTQEDKKKKAKKKPKKKKPYKSPMEKVLETADKLENNKPALRYVLNWVLKLVGYLKPKAYKGYFEYALGEPNYTGYAAAITGMIECDTSFSFKPDFDADKAYIYGNGTIKGHFHLIVLLVHALKLLFNKEVMKLIRGDSKKYGKRSI